MENITNYFRTAFAAYSDGADRFQIKEFKEGKVHFLVVSIYPYRGRTAFGIYCFEEIRGSGWQLRGIVPIVDPVIPVPTLDVTTNGLRISIDDRLVAEITSAHPPPTDKEKDTLKQSF